MNAAFTCTLREPTTAALARLGLPSGACAAELALDAAAANCSARFGAGCSHCNATACIGCGATVGIDVADAYGFSTASVESMRALALYELRRAARDAAAWMDHGYVITPLYQYPGVE